MIFSTHCSSMPLTFGYLTRETTLQETPLGGPFAAGTDVQFNSRFSSWNSCAEFQASNGSPSQASTVDTWMGKSLFDACCCLTAFDDEAGADAVWCGLEAFGAASDCCSPTSWGHIDCTSQQEAAANWKDDRGGSGSYFHWESWVFCAASDCCSPTSWGHIDCTSQQEVAANSKDDRGGSGSIVHWESWGSTAACISDSCNAGLRLRMRQRLRLHLSSRNSSTTLLQGIGWEPWAPWAKPWAQNPKPWAQIITQQWALNHPAAFIRQSLSLLSAFTLLPLVSEAFSERQRVYHWQQHGQKVRWVVAT